MIDDYISQICEVLKIERPKVEHDDSKFVTKTMMAQCSPDGSTIFLKEYDMSNPDQLFAIAHELRHIWQIRYDESYFFDDYNPVNMCMSVEEYNLQIAEVDANAFAEKVMKEFFCLQPQWKGVSEVVIKAIEERMKKIIL